MFGNILVPFLLLGVTSVGSVNECRRKAREFPNRHYPAEWEPHEYTLMSWPSSYNIWGRDLNNVQKDIARVANAIADYERVIMMTSPGQQSKVRSLVGSSVEILELRVDDLWARDTCPAFMETDRGVIGVDFKFNGWGEKQRYPNDGWVASRFMEKKNVPCIIGPITAEGGSFEFDGEGTLMMTESSIVNSNRNPRRSKSSIETSLKNLFNIQKVIWIKGVKGRDITDYHIDCLARFVAPGVVVLGKPGPGSNPNDVWSKAYREAKQILNTVKDAQGRFLKVYEIQDPDYDQIRGKGNDFVASYMNFYIANGAVIMPQFGDRSADLNAQRILKDLFPQRDVVALNVDTIAKGGGGIHCSTHEFPKVR